MSPYSYPYPRPMVTVDAVVFCGCAPDMRVLLIQRGNDPFKGCWALPGGFVEMDESLENAVSRELAEETGLCDVALRQFHTFGDPGRDPRGRNITVAYVGVLAKIVPLHADDDATDAKWFPVNHMPPLAFDHDRIIACALTHVKEIC